MLESLGEALDEFDSVLEQAEEGRRAHVGASAELDVVADEGVRIVRAINGVNRLRFAAEAELLAACESASKVVAA